MSYLRDASLVDHEFEVRPSLQVVLQQCTDVQPEVADCYICILAGAGKRAIAIVKTMSRAALSPRTMHQPWSSSG
jgi:hypothetical protein